MPPLNRFAALLLSLAIASGAAGASTSAYGGLENDEQITSSLVAVAVADKIRRQCDGIAPRIFRALRFANQLKARARERGHSREQIDAFVNDRAQKARIHALRDAYLKSKGVGDADTETLCALGYAEIKQKSLIGYFLRAK